MKALYKMTESEVQTIAHNPNSFGSMLARREMNTRCIKAQIEAGAKEFEVPYKFDANDKQQYERELHSVVWED